MRSVPVAGPELAQKPKLGGFAVVGVFVPLSPHGVELQKPCSVGGLSAYAGPAAANAAPATIAANTFAIANCPSVRGGGAAATRAGPDCAVNCVISEAIKRVLNQAQ